MTSALPLGRRAFLARIGLLGAALGVGTLAPRPVPARSATRDGLTQVVQALRPVLAELSRDTMHGLSVFAVPGPDVYSRAQGTPRAEPGGMEAGTTDFLLHALDNFVPFPDELSRPIAQALATGSHGGTVPIAVPEPTPDLTTSEVATLDAALGLMLENDSTVPLSVAVAGLLNLLATRVNPAVVEGPFLAPFARLSYAEKATAFALAEGPDPDLVALLDAEFPQPLRESVSGLLRFVAGALLEFATFGGYTEHAVFDPVTRRLTGRPVGWELCGYQPDGPVEGWDELIGYYQNRTEVRDA